MTIPDDEDLETVRITRDPVEVQATASCAAKAACTIGFTIDAPFEGVGTVIATAHLIRIGGEFSDEAAPTGGARSPRGTTAAHRGQSR